MENQGNFFTNNKAFFLGVISLLFYSFINFYLIDYFISPTVMKLMPVSGYSTTELTYFSSISYTLWPVELVEFISTRSVIINSIFYIFLFVIVIAIYFKELKFDYDNFSNNSSTFSSIVLIGIPIMYGFTIVGGIIYQLIVKYTGKAYLESDNQSGIEMILSSSTRNVLIISIFIIIVGPFVEEFIFRKAMFNVFKNRWISLIISALIFGYIHNIDGNYTFIDLSIVSIPYIFSGLSFGLIYILSKKNIIPSLFAHIVNNLISIIIILYI